MNDLTPSYFAGNRLIWLILFFSAFVSRSVAQQTPPILTEKKSYGGALYGEVRDLISGSPLSGALISVRRSTVGGRSDETGAYNIRLITLPDTLTVCFFLCTHPSYRSANIIIYGSIRQPLNINIDMIKGEGNSTAEYQIDPKTNQAKLLSVY